VNRQVGGAIAIAAALAAALAVSDAARAATSGRETFSGVIVASGASGARQVVGSVVVARGVFDGVGRIVEVDNLPGDADSVSRDDLVFPGGSIHLLSVTQDTSFSLDPRSCRFKIAVRQTASAVGGTGHFAAASGDFAGTVLANGLARRAADRSCSMEQAPLAEIDRTASNGTLSF
jgi:hypothetical protein